MKKIFLTATVLLALCCNDLLAQKFASFAPGAMAWTSKSKEAKVLTTMAANHLMNVEREQAYRELLAAVEKDPEFTVALAFLSNLSLGEAKKNYAKRALASAQNKTEGEKLFASLVDETSTADERRNTWQKLHNLYPNCQMTAYYHAITRATPEERMHEALSYNKKYPEIAAMYNILGYYFLQDKKDPATAKTYFEKYIQLYPDGVNPYDSMGEFYLLTGDKANAEKYYRIALEKYPFLTSAIMALEKIEASKKDEENKN